MLDDAKDIVGMRVRDARGILLGKVERVFIDPDTHELICLGLDHGILVARRAIGSISDRITLKIDPFTARHRAAAERQQRIIEMRTNYAHI